MYRIVKSRAEKAGLPPGAPVYVGEQKTDKIKITVINYDEQNFEMREIERVEECIPYKHKPSVTWVNVDGLHEIQTVEKIAACFGVHPLIIEDILNTDQRLKVDIFDEYLFLVVKMLSSTPDTQEIDIEQVSIILGKNFVLTFQENIGDIFDPVRNRIRLNKGTIRKTGADHLAYALIDAIVDNYFKILESVGEEIGDIEETLIANPNPDVLRRIYILKREMIYLRKSVWPLREIINSLARGESPLLSDTINIFLRDLYDHTIQVIDTVETYRDMLSGMLEAYHSGISSRMNEIMKFLTIIGTIFIPLTFVVGIYGMNFEYMPELKWKLGYFGVMALTVLIGGSLLLYFKKKKWI